MTASESSQVLFNELIGVDKSSPEPTHPLAYQLAPNNFDQYVGQSHILSKEKPLRKLIEQDKLFSIILWGPPGCGKTSLSRLISKLTNSTYIGINAVTAKVADIKEAIKQASLNLRQNKRTILFVDEIHRFNKLQQDALLPDVENGLITMIGATTENPFFSVIPGLISRSQIYELFPLMPEELEHILDRALEAISKSTKYTLEPDARTYIIAEARGDARKLITLIEIAASGLQNNITAISKAHLESLTQTKGTVYNDDDHYDIVSAFIKSIRGSAPDAAIYWLARMLKGGESPEFIARRLIILASEDIGNADPHALVLATALLQAAKFIGMPEIRINLSQVTAYLAAAPKSNAAYLAINKAMQTIDEGHVLAVPNHLRDSSYKSAKKLGFGKNYKYPHNYPNAVVKQEYLPKKLNLYEPKDIGYEQTIKKRLQFIKDNQ